VEIDVWRHTLSTAAREELSERRVSAASLPIPIEVEAGRTPRGGLDVFGDDKISDRDSNSGLSSP
jgi:hypothetical protein